MTQLEKIRNELIRNNKVYRNWCLPWFCTRLGAHIITLKHEGFEFNAHNEGGDYVYEVVKRPITPMYATLKDIEITHFEGGILQNRLGFTLPPVRE